MGAFGKSCGSSCEGTLASEKHVPTLVEKVICNIDGILWHMAAPTRVRSVALMLGPHERRLWLVLVIV